MNFLSLFHMPEKQSISSLAISNLPKLSVLVSYPIYLTSVRVTVYKHLSYDVNGRRLRYYTAAYRHGSDIINRFGVFSLYRGIEIYLLNSYLRSQIKPATKKIKSVPLKIGLRYLGEALLYPLTLACTRVVAHTTGDAKDWGVWEAWTETVRCDGWTGLFAGVAPFLLSQVYEDLTELAVDKLRKKFPDLDSADEAVARICLAAHGAVAVTPLLTLSTTMRCQSNIKSLPNPQPIGEIVRGIDWQSTALQLAIVTGLCAVNCKFLK